MTTLIDALADLVRSALPWQRYFAAINANTPQWPDWVLANMIEGEGREVADGQARHA